MIPPEDRLYLHLMVLDDFDHLYPVIEAQAVKLGKQFVTVFKGETLITTIDVRKHQQSFNLYTQAKEIRTPQMGSIN